MTSHTYAPIPRLIALGVGPSIGGTILKLGDWNESPQMRGLRRWKQQTDADARFPWLARVILLLRYALEYYCKSEQWGRIEAALQYEKQVPVLLACAKRHDLDGCLPSDWMTATASKLLKPRKSKSKS